MFHNRFLIVMEPPSDPLKPDRRDPGRGWKGARRLETQDPALHHAADFVAPITCAVINLRDAQRDGGRQTPLADQADGAFTGKA